MALLRLREDMLLGTEKHLSAITLTLAEQADRAVQGMDLVLDGIVRIAINQGAVDAATFDHVMATAGVHETLLERLNALPQLNALILYGVDGRVVNSTRSWPTPTINVSDTEAFQSMIARPTNDLSVTSPFQYRTDGKWTVFLMRSMRGTDGNTAGTARRGSPAQVF